MHCRLGTFLEYHRSREGITARHFEAPEPLSLWLCNGALRILSARSQQGFPQSASQAREGELESPCVLGLKLSLASSLGREVF